MQEVLASQTFSLLLLATVLEACQGPAGTAGTPGSSIDRSKLYCHTSTSTLNAATSTLSVSVTCEATSDIPWQGSCESSDMPAGVYLSVDEQIGWTDINAVPGWECGWAAQQNPPNLNFGGAATICCLAVGHTP